MPSPPAEDEGLFRRKRQCAGLPKKLERQQPKEGDGERMEAEKKDVENRLSSPDISSISLKAPRVRRPTKVSKPMVGLAHIDSRLPTPHSSTSSDSGMLPSLESNKGSSVILTLTT